MKTSKIVIVDDEPANARLLETLLRADGCPECWSTNDSRQAIWKTESLARGISIGIRLDLQKIPAIVGHGCELREILTNLIFNAVDAMPQGGTLSFSTRVEDEEVVMEISDTGMGMTEEVRRLCLEPFFTTKGERGSGLGLSMAYGIVQRHSGKLEIESEPGRGTSFILRFPRLRQAIQSVEE